MPCHHVQIGGISGILCTRNAPPPRVHYRAPANDSTGIVLCGRTNGQRYTDNPSAVTCKKCLAWIRAGVLGDVAARLNAKFNSNSGNKP